MEITFTEKAIEKINEKMNDNAQVLKLKYDTDGCGCVVSGVATLWMVQEKAEGDIEIETNSLPILIEKTKTVFYDEVMTIDFHPKFNCFQLKSPSQMLNPRMSLVERSEVVS